MSNRKLFYAKDKHGNRILVEDVVGDVSVFCPHCNAPVVAKRGEKKVWHFAHIGEVCKYLNKNSSGEDKKLGGFADKFVDDIKVEESDKFACRICRSTRSKEAGKNIRNGIWVCKTCYINSSHDDIDKLLE